MSIADLLVCAFPAFFVLATRALFPMNLEDHRAERGTKSEAKTAPDASRLSHRQHFEIAVPYLVIALGLACLVALAQRTLFNLAGRESAAFAYRLSDTPVWSVVVGLFMGIATAMPIHLRFLQWHLGSRFSDLIDRPDRSSIPASLRQDVKASSPIMWGMAVVFALLNLAAFDTFLRVDGEELRYSTFTSVRTHRHPIQTVEELAIFSQRVAPNGRTIRRPSLEVRLLGGAPIDTFYLIENEHIPQVVSAIEMNPAFIGRITRIEGLK